MIPPSLAFLLILLLCIMSATSGIGDTLAGKIFIIILIVAVLVQTQRNFDVRKPVILLASILLAGLGYFILATGTANLGPAGYLFLLMGIALFILFSIRNDP